MPKKVDQRFVHTVEHLWHEGVRSPAHIQEQVAKDSDLLELELPSDRWFQREVKGLKNRDPSDAWGVRDASSESAFFIIQALQWSRGPEGRAPELTQDEARWMERIHFAAPDLTAQAAVNLAREYIRRDSNNEPAWPLDALLGYAPWRSGWHARAFFEAYQENRFFDPADSKTQPLRFPFLLTMMGLYGVRDGLPDRTEGEESQ
jgi:hypothetical protein